MKKSFLLFLVLVPTVVAAAFTDATNHHHSQYINHLQARGVVQGYADGTFRPQQPVNRAEFLKMLLKSIGDPVEAGSNPRCFADFAGTVQWYWPYACRAQGLGIVEGYPDGTFRGAWTVNLAEALKMTIEARDIQLPQYIRAPDNWYDPYLDTAASYFLFEQIPNAPAMQLTRAQAAVILALFDPAFIPNASSSIPSIPSISSSSSSYQYTPPVYHGSLRLEQRPLGNLSTTPGQQNVTLLAFDAIAGRQDVALHQLKFTADSGSLDSGTNYRIYYDSDRNGSAERFAGSAAVQSGRLSFSGLDIRLPEGIPIRVELRADIRQTNAASFAVEFDTGRSDYVEGTGLEDGRELTGIQTDNGPCSGVSICWIAVYTEPARQVTLAGEAGNLYITLDSALVASRQLLAGELSDSLLRLQLRAEDEDIVVTKIRLRGASDNVDHLHLYRAGESTPFATARRSGCETSITGQFCADTDLYVHRNLDVDVTVRAQLKSDTQGTIRLFLSDTTSSDRTAIEAEGVASQQELSQNDGDGTAEGEIFIGRTIADSNVTIEGPIHDIVLAKIVAIINSNPDADGSPVPVGSTTFAIFTFFASEHENFQNGLNEAEVEDITFRVTANNVGFEANSIEIYNVLQPGTFKQCSQNATTGTITVTCSNLDSSSVATAIEQGNAVQLALRGTIANPQLSGGSSTLQAQITGLGSRGSGGPIVWNDEVHRWEWVDVGDTTVRSTLYRN